MNLRRCHTHQNMKQIHNELNSIDIHTTNKTTTTTTNDKQKKVLSSNCIRFTFFRPVFFAFFIHFHFLLFQSIFLDPCFVESKFFSLPVVGIHKILTFTFILMVLMKKMMTDFSHIYIEMCRKVFIFIF